MPPSVRMSQPLRVAGFELIISGRFWVIAEEPAKDKDDFRCDCFDDLTDLLILEEQIDKLRDFEIIDRNGRL